MINQVKLSSINLLLAVLLLSGCGPKDDIFPEEPEEWPIGQNVYVAGVENITQNNSVARLWKNGKMQNLAGSVFRSTETLIGSEARSVFVSGSDVYVAGYDLVLDGDKRIRRARLWKNGEIQPLANGTNDEQAIAVFVSDNNVYVLGSESLQPVPSSWGNWAYKYWKNGEVKIFAEGNSQLGVNSIFVSDGDVYVAGGYDNQAKLWKNGVEENLENGTYANSVFVSGRDVYLAGINEKIAKLWKNGKGENLSNGAKNARAYSVYIYDGDIYVAGNDGDEAKLWKNGIVQDITDDKDARIYHSVFVIEEDIYIAGFVEMVEPVSGDLSIGYFQATLWKNGKKLKLSTDSETNNSWAFSVFVK